MIRKNVTEGTKFISQRKKIQLFGCRMSETKDTSDVEEINTETTNEALKIEKLVRLKQY